MRPPSTTLTGQELEIMKIVWERGTVTVRDVYEALLERRKVAYTTVMTMLKILEQKKYLKKTQADRAHVYRPAQPKGKVIGAMVREFVAGLGTGPSAAVGLDPCQRTGGYDWGSPLRASAVSLCAAVFQLGMGYPLPVRVAVVAAAGFTGQSAPVGQGPVGSAH